MNIKAADYKRLMQILLLLVIFIVYATQVKAQGYVYLINRKLSNVVVKASINGGAEFKLYDKLRDGTGMQKGLLKSDPAVKKIIINGEGKIVITINATFYSPFGEKYYAAEQVLNIQDGDELYSMVRFHGFDDFKLEEVSKKKAKKVLKDKRSKELETITINLE